MNRFASAQIAPWLLLAAVGAVAPARAADAPAPPPKIKLGTLAPTGTTFYKSLQSMGEAWKKAAGGPVLTIYPGGSLGGEADMVALMKTNDLQAALLSGVGLSEIDRSVAGIQDLPLGYHDFGEVAYVLDKLRPTIEKRLADKGFIVLYWTDAGWVRFFTTKPVQDLNELRKLKFFVWSGEKDQAQILKEAGFNPVQLETADIVPGLETGLIEAVPMPPFFALTSQADKRAPYMLDLNWAPMMGALVVRKATWDKLTPEMQKAFAAAAETAGSEIKAANRKESDDAVIAMQKRGLKVITPTPAVLAESRKTAEDFFPRIRGTIIPADVFDDVMKYLKEYRASQAAAKP